MQISIEPELTVRHDGHGWSYRLVHTTNVAPCPSTNPAVDDMASPTPMSKYLSLSMLIVPTVFLSFWFLARFPLPPQPTPIHPSLASLPRDSRAWAVYPEDYYEGGHYVTFPWGRVSSASLSVLGESIFLKTLRHCRFVTGSLDQRRVRRYGGLLH